MPHILITDDDENSLQNLTEIVKKEGFTVATAGCLEEARERIAEKRPDMAFLDLQLPDGNGMDLFQDTEFRATTEIILMTGHASIETTIEALRLGAADYLIKPVNIKQVRAILSRVAKPAALKAEIGASRGELRSLGRFGRMMGASPVMQKVPSHWRVLEASLESMSDTSILRKTISPSFQMLAVMEFSRLQLSAPPFRRS